MNWRGTRFRGSALLSRNHEKNQNNASFRLRMKTNWSKTSTMPRNKVSNDLDHVKQDSKPKQASKGRPSTPEPLPKYTPVKIIKPWTHDSGQLPAIIASNDPYAIFNLLLDEATLKGLIQNINEYAFLYPGPEKPNTRTWFPTTVKEFRAYLAVSIWMSLYSESGIKEF